MVPADSPSRRRTEPAWWPSTVTVTDEQIKETAGTAERSPSDDIRHRLSRRFPRGATMLILTALVVILSGLHVHSYTVISPFDENAHIDRMIRASRFEFVHPDDEASQESLHEVACRGSEIVLLPGLLEGSYDPNAWPPCMEGRYDPEGFTYKGWNSASGNPPYYYFLTGVPARGLSDLPPIGSIVTWGRLLGSLWLLVGIYFVVRAAEYFSIRRLPLVLGVALVIASPSLLHASNVINTDASAFAAGAAVLLAGLAWERSRAPLWLLAVAAAACASLDNTNALGVVIVLFYFLIRAVASRGDERLGPARSWRDYLVAGLVAAASAAIAILAWRIVYQLVAHDVDLSEAPWVTGFRVEHLDLEMVLGEDTIFGVFPPLDGFIPPVLSTTMYELFAQAALILAGGMLIAASVRAKLADRLSALSLATVAALVLTPVMFVIYNYVSWGVFFHILPRTALAALPAIAIVAAAMARTRFGVAVLGIVATGLYLSAAISLL